ncbi:MAG TPA: DUF1080 domain-containing protein [Bryobacteraceae bacterium]|nr:DUF1080 domain-containing protein [Bryobacteraceae bacterium]
MKTLILTLLAAGLLCGQTPQEKKEGFHSLFNGKNLSGWDGDPRLWKVQNGEIVGSTDGVSLDHNEFLISKKKYSDFDLRVQVKLRNHNSGIQFRSEQLPDWVCKGLQADMAGDNYWGNIYDEKGTRGTVVDGWTGKAQKVVKLGDWNDYEVICKGDFIQLKVNGLVTAELHDIPGSPREGVIAFQLHKGPGMKVEWRDIRIKELK